MKDILILKGGDVEVTGAPEVINILPLGHVISTKGEFDVDEESFRSMKQQFEGRGIDLVIDYEHQTLAGTQAPAAGWVKELFLKDGNIAARVIWTPPATQYLENKEYRYLSPVVSVRKSDNKATALHSIALTNTPAIDGMEPLVNSANYKNEQGGTHNMEIIKQIAQLLGIAEDTPDDEVFEALKNCIEEGKALKDAAAKGPADPAAEDQTTEKMVANKAVCELLGLKAGSPTEDVTAKIMSLKSGNIDGVNVLEELKALKQHNNTRAADDAVLVALKAGKITAAQKEWAHGYALGDPKGFASFVEKAPQVVPLGEIEFSQKALKNDKPDEATVIACKQLGVSLEDVAKYGKEC